MIPDVDTLRQQIQDRFPEGLTGIYAIGGTRTGYILAHNRFADDPGHIEDFEAYMDFGMQKMFDFAERHLEFGGKHMIFEVLDIYRLYNRGERYAQFVLESSKKLIGTKAIDFYQRNAIDPYFVGIDTLLHLPEASAAYRLGKAYDEFHQSWSYQAGRSKLIWEIAPISLFSFHHADEHMGEVVRRDLDRKIAAETNLETIYHLLYDYYSQAAYGTTLPMPHFYLASSRNGDIKPRTTLPFGLMTGGPMRIYTVPYPSFYMTRAGFATMLHDLVNDKRFRSLDTDYRGKMTSTTAQQLYQHFTTLANDPTSTVGLSRSLDKMVTSE